MTNSGILVPEMRREQTETVREIASSREDDAAPVKRLPKPASDTRQMHQRLLRALGDRRISLRSR